MKKVIIMLLTISGCSAIGKLEDVADEFEKAEKKIGELNVAACVDECSSEAESCFNTSNRPCIDSCEIEFDLCESDEEGCYDAAHNLCKHLSGPDYYNCKDSLEDECNGNCDKLMSDCTQDCGDQLTDCLFSTDTLNGNLGYSTCISKCIEEMENVLQDINLQN